MSAASVGAGAGEGVSLKIEIDQFNNANRSKFLIDVNLYNTAGALYIIRGAGRRVILLRRKLRFHGCSHREHLPVT